TKSTRDWSSDVCSSDLAMPVAPLPPPPQGPQTPPPPEHNGKAYYIKISAQPDGVFTVMNMRNGFSKTYGAKPASDWEIWQHRSRSEERREGKGGCGQGA